MGENAYMADKHNLAIQHLRAHPAAFVQQTARRVIRFWTGYWSFSRAYLQDEGLDLPNVPFTCVLTSLMLVGLWTLRRRSPRLAWPFLALCLVFPLPYYVTHASMDYRQPIEPEIVVMITYGFLALRENRKYRATVPSEGHGFSRAVSPS